MAKIKNDNSPNKALINNSSVKKSYRLCLRRMDYKFWGFRLPIRHQHHGLTETTVMDSCIIIYRGYYVRLHGTLLPWWMRLLQREIGVMRVTGLSQDKFTLWNIHGYVKRRKTPPMTFNEVNKKGDLIPQGKRADQYSLLRWFSTDA